MSRGKKENKDCTSKKRHDKNSKTNGIKRHFLNCVSGKYFHQYERDRLHSPSVLRRQKKINDKTLQQGKKMV